MTTAGRAALVLLLAAAGLAPSAAADPAERTTVPARARQPEGPVIRVEASYGAGGAPDGGWGWVRVEARNEDDRPHVFGVRMGTFLTRSVEVTRSAPLAPGERTRLFLPQPGMPWGRRMSYLVDGDVRGVSSSGWRGEATTVLVVSGEDAWSARVHRVRVAPTAGPAGSFAIEDVRADDLPDRWTFLSGVALLVLDGRDRGLDAERQRVILDYVRGGGTALVLSRKAIPAGPLADAVAGPAESEAGLGRVQAFDDEDLGAEAPAQAFHRWASSLGGGPSSGSGPPPRPRGFGLLPPGFLERLAIPGLGRVPVRPFFFVILAFAVLVGPVTYLTLRRRRRLGWIVAIVPAAGLLFTAGILGYGVLAEGLGTKGVARSLTLLDQARHEGVCAGSRTLYAGLSPRVLLPSPDTFFHTRDLTSGDGFAEHGVATLEWDLDGGRVGGSALPSRTPVAYGTVTLGRIRERVRFRKAAEGRWEAIPDAAFPPLREPGSVVFRAPDGTWHLGDGGGPLAPAKEAEALAALEERAGWLASMPEAEGADDDFDVSVFTSGYGVPAPPYTAVRQEERRAWVRARLREALRPGSYLVASGKGPFLDDLGLSVRWLAGRHLVVGRLGPEDLDE